MDIVSRFSDLLAKAGNQIEASHKAWAEHLQSVENQQTSLKEEYPRPLTANVWASQNAVLVALSRLQAYEELLKKRMEAFSPVLDNLPQFDVVPMLRSGLQQRPIGPEPRSWQLITSISQVEERMAERLLLLDVLEQKMTLDFHNVTKRQQTITSTVQAPHFLVICLGAKVMDALKVEMDRRMDVEDEHDLKVQFEDAYDQCMAVTKLNIPPLERCIHVMHLQMAQMGMKVARQTLIQEYFKPLDA